MAVDSSLEGTEFADRYEVLRQLDAGGMGAVYVARHKFTDEQVALKVLHQHTSLSPLQRERFLREAGAPGKIGHPGIVRVLDAGETPEGQLYLAMELLEGENLHVLSATRQLTLRRSVEVVIEALSALEAAHARGLVHRDIKPANLFLCRDAVGESKLKLLDFGLIRTDTVTGVETRQGAVMGTARFMSPEQASGSGVDVRSDIWSMGATLHQLVTGRAPFEDVPDADLFRRMLVDEPPSVTKWGGEKLTPSIVEAIDVSMKRDPASRWQSASAMRAVLEEALNEIGLGSQDPGNEAYDRTMPAMSKPLEMPRTQVQESWNEPAPVALAPTQRQETLAPATDAGNPAGRGRRSLERASFLFAVGIIIVGIAVGAPWLWARYVEGLETEGAAQEASEPVFDDARGVEVTIPVAELQNTRVDASLPIEGASATPAMNEARPAVPRRARAGRTPREAPAPIKPETAAQVATDTVHQDMRTRVIGRYVNPNSIAAAERADREATGLAEESACLTGCQLEHHRCLGENLTAGSSAQPVERMRMRSRCSQDQLACRRACSR